jgi:hypothetical protein
MRDLHAAADRLDYWMRRHTIQLYCGNHPGRNNGKFNPAANRLAGLSAIGHRLKDQYNALAIPVPRHSLKNTKTQK